MVLVDLGRAAETALDGIKLSRDVWVDSDLFEVPDCIEDHALGLCTRLVIAIRSDLP